jgi:hypothetical protein
MLSFREALTTEDTADLLYGFLSGSGNSRGAFWLAREQIDGSFKLRQHPAQPALRSPRWFR